MRVHITRKGPFETIDERDRPHVSYMGKRSVTDMKFRAAQLWIAVENEMTAA